MRLKSIDGHVEEIERPASFCPTSPYDLAPPQLLAQALKQCAYQVRAFRDDMEYVLWYSRLNLAIHKLRIPVSLNDLFMVQMNHRYTSFSMNHLSTTPLARHSWERHMQMNQLPLRMTKMMNIPLPKQK